jgi:hypothetical protein
MLMISLKIIFLPFIKDQNEYHLRKNASGEVVETNCISNKIYTKGLVQDLYFHYYPDYESIIIYFFDRI